MLALFFCQVTCESDDLSFDALVPNGGIFLRHFGEVRSLVRGADVGSEDGPQWQSCLDEWNCNEELRYCERTS